LDIGIIARAADTRWYRSRYCARDSALAAKKNQLKPWRVKSWCIPEVTAEFLEKMEHILWLYAQPDDFLHPLVCFDEKASNFWHRHGNIWVANPGKLRNKIMNTNATAHVTCLC